MFRFYPVAVLSFFAFLFLETAVASAADNTWIQNRAGILKQDHFTVNMLLQAGFRYSLYDDDFQGGRRFEIPNARIKFSGTTEKGYFYKVYFGMAGEFDLLDAYAGYRHSDALRFQAGLMKPVQSPDFFISTGSTDFISRSGVGALLVQSYEMGVAAEGDIGRVFYFGGVFNGSGPSFSNNNKFYYIGRLQYCFPGILRGELRLGIHGSHGNSDGIRSGSEGPFLNGRRSVYGADFRIEGGDILLAGEYMSGKLKTEDFPDAGERISGYYFTAGYKLLKSSMILGRYQSWERHEAGFSSDQLTLGLNHDITEIVSFQLNFDTYEPADENTRYGLSVILQVEF